MTENAKFRLKKQAIFCIICLRSTRYERYRNIRNEVIRKEMKGEVVDMSEFLDELERNKTLETAKRFYEETKNKTMAVQFVKCGLNVSMEEAQEIFDTEVMDVTFA